MCDEELARHEEEVSILEEEVTILEEKIAKEEGRTRECQREIDRLRVIVRDYCRIEREITELDYKKLFELWSDFGDEESPAEVESICESLGQMDSFSFKGFCEGFEAAAKLFKEE